MLFVNAKPSHSLAIQQGDLVFVLLSGPWTRRRRSRCASRNAASAPTRETGGPRPLARARARTMARKVGSDRGIKSAAYKVASRDDNLLTSHRTGISPRAQSS